MKILVVYDSYFGNTERIALAIKDAISEKHFVIVKKVDDVRESDFNGVELIMIGSPTRGFRPTEHIVKFLKKIDIDKYEWIAFDTGIDKSMVNSRLLRFLVDKFGYAAPFMGKMILKGRGRLLTLPETFFVKGNEGPLVEGEIERFHKWLRSANL